MATRPCFLVIEREYPGNISARKLVIETAKYNVISCYSLAEAIATLRRFPTVDGIVLSADVKDMPCDEGARELKRVRPETPLIVISPSGHEACEVADQRLSSHDPQLLLEVLKQYVPDISEPAA
jgi:response regulator RpfG family c-di-GMP phosphodiesterase